MALQNAFGDLATAAKQDEQTASLGTDGASPPSIAGTGIRGWLRGIYEKLAGTQQTRIVGNPTGDYAGVDLIERLMDNGRGESLTVWTTNNARRDAIGAQMTSDCPSPIYIGTPLGIPAPVGAQIIIDTQGYAGLTITSNTLACSFTACNNLSGWQSVHGVTTATAGLSSSMTSGFTVFIPAIARYIRLQVTTKGDAVAYLRSSAPQFPYTTATNLTQVGGAVANGGNFGTQNPVIMGGSDSSVNASGVSAPVVRRILTDSSGRTITRDNGVDVTGATSPIGLTRPNDTPLGVPAQAVVDGGAQEGMNSYEMQQAILAELRVISYYLSELPRAINEGRPFLDEPQQLRAYPSFSTIQ